MTRYNPQNVNGELRAFFGRRSGKRLHRGQEALFAELLPELSITLGEDVLDPQALFAEADGTSQSRPITLEIGYGGGEHLALEAGRHPERNYIGCEVFTGGIAKLLQAVDEQELDNIALFCDDALQLLVKLPDASIDEIYLLYPDPWPKTRHHKRRFISPVTLAELARVLKPGRPFYFATDIEDYANWTLAHILQAPGLTFHPGHPGSWHEPYAGWEPTRYERKARREGRLVSFYLTFLRNEADRAI